MTKCWKKLWEAASRLPLLYMGCSITYGCASLSFVVVTSTQAAHASGEIRIAIAVPLTGPQQKLGRELQSAAERAIQSLNADSGVLGQSVVSFVFDDGCSMEPGVAAARSIIASTVKFAAVFGHPCGSIAKALATTYSSAEQPLFVTGVTPPRTVETSPSLPHIYRIPRDRNPAAGVVDALKQLPQGARIAIVRDKTQFATTFAQTVQTEMSKTGRGPATTETFSGGDKDFHRMVERMRTAETKQIIFAGFPAEATLLLDELKRSAPDIPVIGSDSLAAPEFSDVAARHSTRLQVLLPAGSDYFTPATDARIQPTQDVPAQTWRSLAVVAAIEAWAQAAKRAQSISASDIARELSVGMLHTSMGEISFDARGQSSAPSLVLYRWLDGRWRPEQPPKR